MKLSKVLLCWSMTQFKHSRWLEIEFPWGFYEQFKNHFLFLKLISTERLSILHCDLHCHKHDGMSSLIYNRRPRPLSFLLYPVGTGRKLNVYKTLRRRPGHLLNLLCTFNLRRLSTGRGGYLCGVLKPSILNWAKVNESSSFVSKIRKM